MFSHNLPKIYFLPFGVLMLFKKKKKSFLLNKWFPTYTNYSGYQLKLYITLPALL